jgi:N-acyl homoserine lactone hydrolase
MTDVRKLYIFLCGYEIIRKSACTRGLGDNFILAVPICAYLLDTAQGLVMFDTGLDSARLADDAHARALFKNDRFPAPPIVLPEHELLPQLAAIGVAPDDVSQVILSHTHVDHVGYLRHFRRARVVIQRVEHAAAFSDEDRGRFYFSDLASPDIDWHLTDGDCEIMPGLDVVLTGGHRPGHQSLVVQLPESGTKVLTADVADLRENFDKEILGSAIDDVAALASIRRLNAIVASTGAELVPFHDPDFVHTARLAPLFYA